MECEEFKRFIGQVEGLCPEGDCFLLYSLVKDLKLAGDILDIGSFKGRVAISFAQALKDIDSEDKIYAIEANLFKSKYDLLKNIERFDVRSLVVPVFKHSAKANIGWTRPLKLIWVDTDGNYFSSRCDFFLWEPFLVKGGLIAFSCASSDNIKRVVENCIIASKRFEGIKTFGSIVFAYKHKEGSPYFLWKTGYIMLLYTIYYQLKKIVYNSIYKNFPFLAGCSTLKRLINKSLEKTLKITGFWQFNYCNKTKRG